MKLQKISTNSSKPAILVFNSQVIRGAVGGRVSVFVLESLGFPVWFVPTVLIPWHPGHGKSSRQCSPPAKFGTMVEELANSKWISEIGGILTGYLGDENQADAITDLIKRIKKSNPKVQYLCDPVIGDGTGSSGALYVKESIATGIQKKLLPIADIITPNLFEIAWLSKRKFEPNFDCVDACRRIKKERVVVTSVRLNNDNSVGNMLIDGKNVVLAEHGKLEGVPNGLGDLVAALTLAGILNGLTGRHLLRRVSASVVEVAHFSSMKKLDELPLAQNQRSIKQPWAPVIIKDSSVKRKSKVSYVAGVDGCPGGWIAVFKPINSKRKPIARVFANFADLITAIESPQIFAVDMPIGLPDKIGKQGRGPDWKIRRLLGKRRSSVYPIPSRSTVYCEEYFEACKVALATSVPSRKVSKQCFALFPKIREVDWLMTRDLEERVYEVHPELAFWRLNNGNPMCHPKHTPKGIRERCKCLKNYGFEHSFLSVEKWKGVKLDDLIDACANAVIAEHIHQNRASPFPENFERDSKGLRIAIWA